MIAHNLNTSAVHPSPPLPALYLAEWQDTCTTLHMLTQIVGKIRLQLSPLMNHWWQVPLYLTTRGLSTSPMYSGDLGVQIDFDFIDHLLRIETSRGDRRSLPLADRPIAAYYRDLMDTLRSLGIDVKIWTVPVEVEQRIPFEQDQTHASYDAEYARRFWQVLFQVDRVMKLFRSRFRGKSSPVHFFWGSFDLTTTRYSGRAAPLIQTTNHVARYVMQEAYSAEESSCGFWAGAGLGEPAFYAYTYPQPPGYPDFPIQPADAYFHPEISEFILPYEAVRTSPHWEDAVLSFFQTTYEAAADLAKWDRQTLERPLLVKPAVHP
ncbi:MAG: DUF5996 family protein [Anaerolineaceae bacterium]|nr:DUF5996 family protein [Anaerolineaceae bacterium]